MKMRIGQKEVGRDCPCYVIAELGINHNGSLEIAKQLIDTAKDCGCDAVKFQKRTIDVVYTPEELSKPRATPYGTTNGDLKRRLEFSGAEYEEIDNYCQQVGIQWMASCWDQTAVDFIAMFDPPAYKIASASLTDAKLLAYTANTNKPILLSTGMSDHDQVGRAVDILEGNPLAILHCVSTYPTENADLNLACILDLMARYGCVTGYSGHEHGIATSVAAVVLGAAIIERHLTLDRSMFGSDQSASLEPQGMARLVRDIRAVEESIGDGVKRVLPAEVAIADKLRRVTA